MEGEENLEKYSVEMLYQAWLEIPDMNWVRRDLVLLVAVLVPFGWNDEKAP